MLLFAFGFVARTGFIFAAWRSAVIVAGFVVAAILYPGRGSLVVDAFIFGAAVIGTLLALATPRAVAPPRLLSGHRHHPQADALRLEKERADALLLNVLPAIDRLTPPRR